nr:MULTISPECIES: Rap1a/Tai family immunity protein [unclassified Pantoea]
MSLASAPASAISTSDLVKVAKGMVAQSAPTWDDGYFYGYVIGTLENMPQMLCLPDKITNGEIVNTAAYSIIRHSELYSLSASEMIRRILMLEYSCK